MVKLKIKGEHYVIQSEDAKIVREMMGQKGDGEMRVPIEQISEIVNGLVKVKGCTVEEYGEVNGKEMKIREASPGNWIDFAECLVDETETGRIAGIVVKKEESIKKVHVASFCTINKTMDVYEFVDNEIHTNLMHVMYEQNIKEAVYVDDEIERVCSAMQILSHNVRHTGVKASGTSEKDRACQMVCKYLNIRMEEYEAREGAQENVLKMDAGVVKAVLDGEITLWDEIKCITAQGKRLLRVFMRLPLACKEEIQRRVDIVDEMRESAEVIRKRMHKVPDILVICKRLCKGRVTIQDIRKVYECIESVKHVIDNTAHITHMSTEYKTLHTAYGYCEEVMRMIEEVVDINRCEVKHDYNEVLQRLNEEKVHVEREIAKEYNREVQEKSLNSKKVKLEYSSMYGYHMKMPRTESNAIMGKGVVQLSTQKSGVLFTTEQIKRYNTKIHGINTEVGVETEKIVLALRDGIRVYKEWLEIMNHMVGMVDVLSALSYFAVQNSLSKPVFTEGEYAIHGAYHPLLPAIHRRQMKQGVNVPEITRNDLVLTDSRFCVITGPNMGGKTTFLKTVALITIMAQMGSFVPAESAHIPIFRQLFIRIGASDSPDDNISTFMAEMIDVSKILNEATSDSLVIIDELGRGTSDADGYAIAQATTEHVVSLGATTLFATHFHDICSTPNVVNKRVGCIQNGSHPILTYKIEDGTGEQSYGINVARVSGFPQSVIDMAEQALSENISMSTQNSQSDKK